jgi:hypothetical protein
MVSLIQRRVIFADRGSRLPFVLFGWGMRGDTAGFEKVAIKN